MRPFTSDALSQGITESSVEEAALTCLENLGGMVKHSPEIAPGELAAERADFRQVVLAQRLRDALARLNAQLPAEALTASRKHTHAEGVTLEARKRAVHQGVFST
jgi:type I restriction enzyme, R subunit